MAADVPSPALAGWTDEQLRDELRAREVRRAVADLPPIGTRWGDLTDEQRRGLPPGTRLGPAAALTHEALVRRAGAWRREDGEAVPDSIVNAARRIISYPEAP